MTYSTGELDGFAFEDAVAHLFRRLGYAVESGGRIGDSGRDLIASRGPDVVVIECKNHAKPIGRPVVQKLHSAAITYGKEARGLIVSPSGFTAEALEYVEGLRVGLGRIELWDFARLFDAGQMVGITFTARGCGDHPIFMMPRVPDEQVGMWLWENYLAHLETAPRSPRAAMRVSRRLNRSSVGVAVIDFHLDRTFDSTSRNRRIHRACASGRSVVALNGASLSDQEIELISAASLEPVSRDRIESEGLLSLFGANFAASISAVKARIAESQSRFVSYRGHNHRAYSKEVVVDPRDVAANGLPVVYERTSVVVQCGPRRHEIGVLGKSDHLMIAEGSVPALDIAALQRCRAQVCNDCGCISAVGRRGGGRCCRCGRTLCREHSRWRPRHPFLMQERLCSSCVLNDSGVEERDRSLWAPVVSIVPGVYWVLAGRPLLAVSSAAIFTAGAIATAVFASGFMAIQFIASAMLLSLIEGTMDTVLGARYRARRAALRGYVAEWSGA